MAKPTNAKRRAAPAPRTATKKAPPPPPPSRRPAWAVPAIAVGAVLALLLVAVVVSRLGGGDGGGGGELAQTRPVTVQGTALPVLPNSGADPAVGMKAPVVSGASFDGTPVEVGGSGRPTLVFFVAHWCPHCQKEVPLLAPELGRITPPGVEVLTVTTSTKESAPNYPPSKWLEEQNWPSKVLADDAEGSAATAYGLSGFPFFVLMDRDGEIVARGSGEKTVAEVEALLKRAGPAAS